MSSPIALIDYGAGNLTSVKKALAAVGADFFVPNEPGALIGARGVVVPGVGHAPTLSEPTAAAAIDEFLARVP